MPRVLTILIWPVNSQRHAEPHEKPFPRLRFPEKSERLPYQAVDE